MKPLILSPSILAIALSLSTPPSIQAENTTCTPVEEGLYAWIKHKIEVSQYSKPVPIECQELKVIEGYKDEEVQITSGRQRGKYYICLTNTKENPCQHKIAELVGYEAPSVLISRIFGASQAKPEYLNETVERLFLRPSSLIKATTNN